MFGFRLAAAVAAALVIGAPLTAQAATFDFATMSDDFYTANGYEGTWDQVTGGTYTVDGVTITDASATWTSNGTTAGADPFFDSSAGMNNRDAGLGVCHSGTKTSTGRSNCATPTGSATSDDNLTQGEALTLTFDGPVTMTSLTIRDENHYGITDTSAVIINGVTYSAVNGIVTFSGGLTASSFTFVTEASGNPQIYLSSMTVAPVPVPAGVLMLPGGLLLLILLRRRRPLISAAA